MCIDSKRLNAGKIRHECRAGTVERLLLKYFGQKISQSGQINEAPELEEDGMGIYDAYKPMDSKLICKFLQARMPACCQTKFGTKV